MGLFIIIFDTFFAAIHHNLSNLKNLFILDINIQGYKLDTEQNELRQVQLALFVHHVN
jgi:hypothetical protein